MWEQDVAPKVRLATLRITVHQYMPWAYIAENNYPKFTGSRGHAPCVLICIGHGSSPCCPLYCSRFCAGLME
jgi:hypothetical protein